MEMGGVGNDDHSSGGGDHGGGDGREHVVMFPFMAKGHTVPVIHLAAALSRRGLRVTILTTPANAPFLRRSLPRPRLPPRHRAPPRPAPPPLTPTRRRLLLLLPSPALLRRRLLTLLVPPHRPRPRRPRPRLPRHVRLLHGHVQVHLSALVTPPSPSSSSAFAAAINGGDEVPFTVPGDPRSLLFAPSEVPSEVRNPANPEDPVTRFLVEEIGPAERPASWGVLVNSFAELDREYVDLFEGFYRGGGGGARAWLVGPMSLLAARVNAEEEEDPTDHDPEGCLAWLDEHRPGEAVYVAFGTQAHVADAQLDEAAHGLVGSGHPFLWAVRSETWAPPAPLAAQIQSRGKIVRGWAPQNAILGHVAVGGFVTHCGWNSVLESLSAGKPMLAWPMIAEQVLNAKHLVEILGAGVRVRDIMSDGIVTRDEVAAGVREVMGGGGERGQRARARAVELRDAAAAAVAEGGTSWVALENLLQELRKIKNYETASSNTENSMKDDVERRTKEEESQQHGVQIV
ncbi:LOW QUALITY PROTEIN: UDP-glycosyltransferase 73B4-like [Ananas comosus]|uniref:Glycosyltransferase n=1 Tax=Ananas comosus TaxID=4615 RepID=A0A6P5FAV6_ANACO|nr:LOW QUALITY PROTEIN: UDP-glycosyltransferase 73B4-like [Ananas comosus]